MKLQEYFSQMSANSMQHLIAKEGLYSGKEGHLRFAHECGAAIPDFTEKEQKEFLSASYGALYVRACDLRPILDAKEWIAGLCVGRDKRNNMYENEIER